MENIEKLVEALQKGESVDEVVTAIAADYEAKLKAVIYPMETWQAPLWAAVMLRAVEGIKATVPYSYGAIDSMLAILANADKGDA